MKLSLDLGSLCLSGFVIIALVTYFYIRYTRYIGLSSDYSDYSIFDGLMESFRARRFPIVRKDIDNAIETIEYQSPFQTCFNKTNNEDRDDLYEDDSETDPETASSPTPKPPKIIELKSGPPNIKDKESKSYSNKDKPTYTYNLRIPSPFTRDVSLPQNRSPSKRRRLHRNLESNDSSLEDLARSNDFTPRPSRAKSQSRDRNYERCVNLANDIKRTNTPAATSSRKSRKAAKKASSKKSDPIISLSSTTTVEDHSDNKKKGKNFFIFSRSPSPKTTRNPDTSPEVEAKCWTQQGHDANPQHICDIKIPSDDQWSSSSTTNSMAEQDYLQSSIYQIYDRDRRRHPVLSSRRAAHDRPDRPRTTHKLSQHTKVYHHIEPNARNQKKKRFRKYKRRCADYENARYDREPCTVNQDACRWKSYYMYPPEYDPECEYDAQSKRMRHHKKRSKRLRDPCFQRDSRYHHKLSHHRDEFAPHIHEDPMLYRTPQHRYYITDPHEFAYDDVGRYNLKPYDRSRPHGYDLSCGRIFPDAYRDYIEGTSYYKSYDITGYDQLFPTEMPTHCYDPKPAIPQNPPSPREDEQCNAHKQMPSYDIEHTSSLCHMTMPSIKKPGTDNRRRVYPIHHDDTKNECEKEHQRACKQSCMKQQECTNNHTCPNTQPSCMKQAECTNNHTYPNTQQNFMQQSECTNNHSCPNKQQNLMQQSEYTNNHSCSNKQQCSQNMKYEQKPKHNTLICPKSTHNPNMKCDGCDVRRRVSTTVCKSCHAARISSPEDISSRVSMTSCAQENEDNRNTDNYSSCYYTLSRVRMPSLARTPSFSAAKGLITPLTTTMEHFDMICGNLEQNEIVTASGTKTTSKSVTGTTDEGIPERDDKVEEALEPNVKPSSRLVGEKDEALIPAVVIESNQPCANKKKKRIRTVFLKLPTREPVTTEKLHQLEEYKKKAIVVNPEKLLEVQLKCDDEDDSSRDLKLSGFDLGMETDQNIRL